MRFKNELISALLKEVALKPAIFANSPLLEVETIYFGGGTPSLCSKEEISAIIASIKNNYPVSPLAEITLEANPDDINEEKLLDWKTIGINRLSIGIQSFFEEDLQWMNRAHNAQQATNNLQLASKYFDNITADLIYGTPGLTDEKWKHNVDTMISMGIPHLSCYALTVEPKTPLQKLIQLHQKEDVDPDKQSEQFLLLMKWMEENGYEHYEISNFAKPGYRSRHNSGYWQGKPYLGIGPSAHSFNGQVRWWNIAHNAKYIESIDKGLIPYEEEVLTPSQKLNEYIMISLRTMEGIDMRKIEEKQKQRILKASAAYFSDQLMEIDGHFLRLTKSGRLLADGIASNLFE